MLEFCSQRQVRQRETDASGFVHFANYVRYMEETEYAFLRSIGLSVVLQDARGTIGFPRLDCQLKVFEPLRAGQSFEVSLSVLANDGKSIDYGFKLGNHGQIVATGSYRAACCRFPASGRPYAIPIPDRVLAVIPLAEAIPFSLETGDSTVDAG